MKCSEAHETAVLKLPFAPPRALRVVRRSYSEILAYFYLGEQGFSTRTLPAVGAAFSVDHPQSGISILHLRTRSHSLETHSSPAELQNCPGLRIAAYLEHAEISSTLPQQPSPRDCWDSISFSAHPTPNRLPCKSDEWTEIPHATTLLSIPCQYELIPD
jgi:hypothetical protein